MAALHTGVFNKLPPQVALVQIASGYWITKSLWAFTYYKVPDLLKDGPKTAETLAEEGSKLVGKPCNAGVLSRILRVLVTMGIVAEADDKKFALTDLGQFLRSDHPGSCRNTVLMASGPPQFNPYTLFADWVETGESPYPKLPGNQAYWDFLASQPHYRDEFAGAMAEMSHEQAAKAIATYDFSQAKTVVDIGGSHGFFAGKLVQSFPNITKAIVYDQHDVVPQQKEGSAVSFATGNFLVKDGDSGIPQGADIYTMKMILHDWRDEEATVILNNIRKAMKPGAKLLVIDAVMPPHGSHAPSARWLNIHLGMLMNGIERTQEEWTSLLHKSGFKVNRVLPTGSSVDIVEAELLGQ